MLPRLSSFTPNLPPTTPTLFPTRRSSDLPDRQSAPPRWPRRRGGGPAARDRLRHGGDRPGRGRSRSRDRKSTRLNSSHQIISSAVFCLKIKNIKEITIVDLYTHKFMLQMQ